jgi:hypothetical protein
VGVRCKKAEMSKKTTGFVPGESSVRKVYWRLTSRDRTILDYEKVIHSIDRLAQAKIE